MSREDRTITKSTPPARRVAVSAPGKLILMGEHAAVYGHPALVAAVDLRLIVTAELRPQGADPKVEFDLPQLDYQRSLRWETIYHAADQARQAWSQRFEEREVTVEPEGEVRPPLGVTPAQLVQLALGEASQHLGESLNHRPPASLHLRIDSALPVGSGFGSSAALAVGVAGAYLSLRGCALDEDELLELSLNVERRQHGTPSGIDNAAVLFGGLLWADRAPDGRLDCRRLTPAGDLLGGFRVFHSGPPGESTGAVVSGVRRHLERAPETVTRALEGIGQCTRLLLRHLEEGATRHDTVALVRRCSRALEELGVVPEPVRTIVRRIEAAGGAAKISGAGSLSGSGAGSILVFHPEPERMQQWSFLRAWRRLPVHFPAAGLRLEPSA